MRFSLIVGIVLFGCIGCGGPVVTQVTGHVTVGGAPVPNGSITFVNDDPTSDNASAQIAPDGRYELKLNATTTGVKPGTYKVRVAAYTSMPTDMPTKKEAVKDTVAIHRKYFDPKTSGLTAIVVAGGAQTIDFKLDGP